MNSHLIRRGVVKSLAMTLMLACMHGFATEALPADFWLYMLEYGDDDMNITDPLMLTVENGHAPQADQKAISPPPSPHEDSQSDTIQADNEADSHE